MIDNTVDSQAPRRSLWMRLLPLVAIVAVGITVTTLFGEYFSFEFLREKRADLIAFRDVNYLVAIVVFIAIYTLIVALSLPGATVASLTGGFLFGIAAGTFFNIIAATLGATIVFLAISYGFGERLSTKMDASDGKVKQLKDGIDNNQWSMLFLIRLLPIVPFLVANIVPALVGVPLRRFVISTFFGIMPGALVYTSMGAGLSDVFARGETPDFGIIFEPFILIPLLGLSVLAILPIIVNAVRAKRETK